VRLTGFSPPEGCTVTSWSASFRPLAASSWLTRNTEMLLLPALTTNRSRVASVRLFGAASPSRSPSTTAFAASSKAPLPVPPVAYVPAGRSLPSASRLKTTTVLRRGSLLIEYTAPAASFPLPFSPPAARASDGPPGAVAGVVARSAEQATSASAARAVRLVCVCVRLCMSGPPHIGRRASRPAHPGSASASRSGHSDTACPPNGHRARTSPDVLRSGGPRRSRVVCITECIGA
jgi:hypothetical protein